MVSERFKDRKRLGLERVIGREEAEWRDPLRVRLVAPNKNESEIR